MIDSTNPRQLADNIRKLWDKFKSISGDLLPSRSTATTGQILKLTGENKTPSWADEYSYTPPAYSETEVNTVQKWIDGKDVYTKVLTGTSPDEGTTLIIGNLSADTVITAFLRIGQGTLTLPLSVTYNTSNGNLSATLTAATQNSKPFICIVTYTKPDPAPETRDDDTEAPEEKKTTRKKK